MMLLHQKIASMIIHTVCISWSVALIAQLRPVFLLIQSLVRHLVQGFWNVLFWLHCVVKQNIWEVSYEAKYKALNE